MKTTFNCKYCGKSITDYDSNRSVFCSKSCYGKHKSTKVSKICPKCGKEFFVPKKKEHTRTYCSRACQSTTTEFRCDYCNKTFTSKTNNRKKSVKFCSTDCRNKYFTGEHNPNWLGGLSPQRQKDWYSPSYQKWRRLVLVRDDYTCQECGKKETKIQVHHIKQYAVYPDLRYDIDNGKVLCVDCHNKIPSTTRDAKGRFMKMEGSKNG